ncbi:MAG TPA: cation diffusion facilitator family transporter [Xanthobacteraceae bacterium]|uniref:cation diffusion facilitator family transporter n=1 Tax=Roseixanthobacter finlandensis TaxID=3119922 RepID=UPI0026D91E96|nr:cation diffusion facilitator family transporter [Xanthobacteraceae bacterium]HQS47151.1 cation diffusion facilitator family transporter [Xanthobacteraceae bacterium]
MSGSTSQNLSFQAMIFVACLFPFYVLAATMTNSAAVLTDLLATSFDLTSLTACWLVLRIAHKGNAGRYAYGLGKLENLAELMIAVLQVVLVIIASSRAIMGVLHPEPVSGAGLGLAVTFVAVVGNAYLNRKAVRLARETKSPVLAAQARVHLVSACSSGSVFIVTVITSAFDEIAWVAYLDPAASFVVIAFMVYNIFEMLTNSLGSLLDQAIGEAGQLRILKALTAHFDDFEELGDIRTRSHGGKMMVELHLGFDPAWTVAQARDAVAELSASVKAEFAKAGDDVDVAIVLLPPTARTFSAAMGSV